jgi:hypothetical protein
MAQKKTTTRKAKKNFDPITTYGALSTAQGLGRFVPKQGVVNRFLTGRRNPEALFKDLRTGTKFKFVGEWHPSDPYYIKLDGREYRTPKTNRVLAVGMGGGNKKVDVVNPRGRNPEDIDFLNDLAPMASQGHIEFTPDGIERYARDGYIYAAYSATPVQEDGYRMGTVEGTANAIEQQLVYENPRRGRRNPSSDVTYIGSDGTFEYWQWADNIYRNLLGQRGYMIDPTTAIALPEGTPGGLPSGARWEAYAHHLPMIQRLIAASGTQFDASGQYGLSLENPRRARRNPASDSDAMYESFHGAPPSETLEIAETEYAHDHLGALGDLVNIEVKLTGGKNKGAMATITAPDPNRSSDERIVHLTGSADGSSLYFTGGDEALDVKQLGFRDNYTVKHDGEAFEATELKDLMVIGHIHKITYRTEKSFDDFETIDYYHKAGEDTKECPTLLYDTLNDRMKFAGGAYTIHEKGIVN